MFPFLPPFNFSLGLLLCSSKRTSASFTFVEYSEHRILEEERAPWLTVSVDSLPRTADKPAALDSSSRIDSLKKKKKRIDSLDLKLVNLA